MAVPMAAIVAAVVVFPFALATGFTAGFLYGLTRLYGTRAELEAADLDALEGHARFGCLIGTHVVTKLGAVAGLPTLAAVRR